MVILSPQCWGTNALTVTEQGFLSMLAGGVNPVLHCHLNVARLGFIPLYLGSPSPASAFLTAFN